MNFIQQAYKGKNEWYHWVITIILVFFGWQVLGAIPLLITAFKYSTDFAEFIEAGKTNFMGLGIDSNLFLTLMILMFFIGLVFLYIGVKYIHKRRFTSLITSRKKVDWKRTLFSFCVWGIIAVVITLIGIFLTPENYVWNFKPVPFTILLAVSFLFLPFQTSFEELLFRGYFMQGIGVFTNNKKFPFYLIYTLLSIFIMIDLRKEFNYDFTEMCIIFTAILIFQIFVLEATFFSIFFNSTFNLSLMKFFNSKLTPLIITSAVFGLLHSANPEVAKLGYITMVFYIGTGLFYGIVTLMDEGTELSLGLHAINNIVAAFFVTTNWSVFQTDALYIDTSEPAVSWDIFLSVFILYPLILWLFSKKYGWKNWKEKLTGKVYKPLSLKENYKVSGIGNNL
ncbi:MAG: CPBP family glutamic-type intramembrane protease [Polaribacter sp.]